MKRVIVPFLALILLVSVTGCGGRLASKVKEAATARSEIQSVMSDEPGADRILFRDDFEDGDLADWQSTATWSVRQEADSKVMVAAGSGQSAWVPQGAKWTDYYVHAGVKLESGGVGLAFRISRDGGYWLLYRADGLHLMKEFPKGNYTPLTQTEPPAVGTWHSLSFGGYGGHLQVFVDQELQMDYVDSDPLTKGTVGVAVSDSSSALVDNVIVVKLLSDLPAPAEVAALPATVAPQSSADLDQGWVELEDWAVSDEPAALVEPTATPGGEWAASDEEWVESEEEWVESDEEWSASDEEWLEEQSFELIDEPSIVESGGDLPVIDYFYAEPADGEPGCYFLHWDLHGADSASLNGEGITAPGSGQVCEVGTFTLVAQNAQGSVEETVVISAEGEVEDIPQLPDLFIGDLLTSVPDSNNPNEVLIEIRVRNGGAAPSGPFAVRWYAHQRENVVGCSIDVDQLEPHTTNWWRCTYTYPAHEFGTMHWRSIVDEEGEVAELDEENNVHDGTVDIARSGEPGDQGGEGGDLPDLAPMNMHVVPSELAPGQTGAMARFIVQNKGEGASGATNALWYMGNVTNWAGNCEVPAMEPGGYHQCEVELGPVPAIADGVYDQVAIADPEGEIDESSEDNNQLTHHTVTIVSEASDEPDLIIEDVYFDPSPVVPGQPFKAYMTIRNVGSAEVDEPITALWHFHDALGLVDCDWTVTASIIPGSGANLACERTTNAVPGQAPTWLTVDTENAIHESNEINNDVSLNLTVASVAGGHPDPSTDKPDLVVRNLQLDPSQVNPGQTGAVVRYTVLNQGDGPAGPSTGWWYLIDGVWIGGCDVPALGPGEKHRCETELMPAPEDVSGVTGQWARADLHGDVDESDEDNNDLHLFDSVTFILSAQDHPDPVGVPDLVIRNLSMFPNPAGSGQDLLIEFDVVNKGVGPAAASEAQWTTPPATGLSYRCSVPVLQPGASFHCSRQLAAPTRKATYGIRTTADVDDDVSEGSGEDNNTVQETLKVQ